MITDYTPTTNRQLTSLHPHLYIGNLDAAHDFAHRNPDVAVVHACKDPCHRLAACYTTQSLEKSHPHYLSVERDNHLYLNLIDPPVPLFQMESFERFFEFTDRHIPHRPVIIHCNQGLSRAPSLGLLYMAKRLDPVFGKTYADARKDFEKLYPAYAPGKGIETFLNRHWTELGA